VGLKDNPADERDGLLSRRDLVRRTAGLGAAFAVPGVLAACGSSSSSAGSASSAGSQVAAGSAGGKPRRGGQLTVALNDGGATDSLSPWNIPTYSGAARANQVYERLFKYDVTGATVPALALSAEADATGTRWRVKLRSGVTFHDGKTMTAEDVLYSFRYVADPKHNSESLQRLQSFDLNASRTVSPSEVEFVLKQPLGDFKGLLASKTLWIVPAGMTDFSKPIGTGPFVFKSWQPGVRALYERNPHYWQTGSDGGPPWVDSLQFQTITDDTARLNALLGGQVQEMTFIGFSSAKAQASNSAITIIRTPQPNTTPIYMQIDAPQFRDVRVRQALKMVLNREEMVNNVLLGFGSIGNDLFGKGLASYNADIPQRPYDPQKAAALLKQAAVQHLQLALPTSDASQGMLQSAVVFKQQAAVVGINVTLQKLDSGTYFTNNEYLKVPFYQTNWGQSFESQALDGLLRNSPYNETHWYDKRWAAEFVRAEGIIDPAKRIAAYKALQEPLWEDSGYIVWGVYETLDAASPKIHGIVPNISPDYQNLGGFDFKYHWLAS
jgi:peptide/nickel transport system substrate-binding protein